MSSLATSVSGAPPPAIRNLLNQTSDDTQCVMQRPIRLLQHQLVGAPDDDGARFARSCHACDLDTLASPCLDLLHHLSRSQVLCSEVVEGSYWAAAKSFAEELNIFPLYVLDHHNLHLVKEMCCKV